MKLTPDDGEILTGVTKQLHGGTIIASSPLKITENLPGSLYDVTDAKENFQPIKPDSFDYNAILQESGLPYDSRDENVMDPPQTSRHGKGYFGIKRKRACQKPGFQESENHAAKSGSGASECLPHSDTQSQEPQIQISTICQSTKMKKLKKHMPIDQTLHCAVQSSKDSEFTSDAIESDAGHLSVSKTIREDNFLTSVNDDQGIRLANDDEEAELARLDAEKEAVIRSLKTNLILILICVLSISFLLIPSKFWQMYFCVVYWFVYFKRTFSTFIVSMVS